MRRTVLAVASVAALACLGACGNDSDSASDEAVVVAPTPSPVPASLDPFAWSDVAYQDYLDAADQLGLRPDVLVPEAAFSSGLNTLCRTSAEDMVTMRSQHQSYTENAATYSTAKYLAEEVGLRIGLACPQRMTDWTAAGYDSGDDIGSRHRDDSGDDGVSAVTDEDLARATAEEAAASSAPDYDEAGESESDVGDSAESNESDAHDSEHSEESPAPGDSD